MEGKKISKKKLNGISLSSLSIPALIRLIDFFKNKIEANSNNIDFVNDYNEKIDIIRKVIAEKLEQPTFN